jgi:hypothetical protein
VTTRFTPRLWHQTELRPKCEVTSRTKVVWQHTVSFIHYMSKVSIQSCQQDDKNCDLTLDRLSYNAKRCACACIQMYSFSSFAILKFNQNQDGGHFDFVNNYNVCGINGNPTLNKMMPVWCKSIKQPRSYWIYCVFSLLPFYGWELRGQDSIAPQNSR